MGWNHQIYTKHASWDTLVGYQKIGIFDVDLHGHLAILTQNFKRQCSTLLLYTDLGWPRGITRPNVLLSSLLPTLVQFMIIQVMHYLRYDIWMKSWKKVPSRLNMFSLNYARSSAHINLFNICGHAFSAKASFIIYAVTIHSAFLQWASYQIRKIAGAHAPGMPGTFSPSPQVSDPDMHHGTCVTHVPWCMPGSLTSGFLWNRRRGKTFPAFPAHAQPAILRIW